ncbi:hypothetical protein KHP62_02625 [Rhodobacteraceae bacterium NNCM2]|nr:hypothetical protein [Coraliihabitans acroporae]
MAKDIDFSQMDFETALRVAKQRGMAERSKETRRIFGGIYHSVRNLFSTPEAATETKTC